MKRTGKSTADFPNLQELFVYYDKVYFNNKLSSCAVEWSDRMTSTAGSCRFSSGGCTIKISEPLHKLRPVADLKSTLLHEMIHALMFLEKVEDRDGHGDFFQKMMVFINEARCKDIHRPEEGYNITIYHDFEHEAEFLRKHWWKCEKCENEVRRAVNRKPQEADCARVNIKNGMCCDRYCSWHQHLKTCGGEYIKVRGPPSKPQKRLLSSVGSPLKRRRKNKPCRYLINLAEKEKLEDFEVEAEEKVKKDSPEHK